MREIVVLLSQRESRPGPWMLVKDSDRFATISIQGLEEDGAVHYEVEEPAITIPVHAAQLQMELLPKTKWRVRKIAGAKPRDTTVKAAICA